MATGRKTVAPGQIVASDWGNTVWDQSVQTFASAADRATQYPAPHAGAVSWIEDAKRLDTFQNGAWQYLGPNQSGGSFGAVLWGTVDPNKPVSQVGGVWGGQLTSSSGVTMQIVSGRPWVALLDVQVTPVFLYNDPNHKNLIPMLNAEQCFGNATGGQITITCVNFGGTGPGAVFTGLTTHITFQM